MYSRRRLLGLSRTPGILVADGDSITATSNATLSPYLAYPQQAARLIGGGPFALYNIAVPGDTLTDITTRFNVTQAISDPLTASFGGTGAKCIYSLMGGVNDVLAGATAAQIIALLENLYTLASAYYDVVIGHCIIGQAQAGVTLTVNNYLRSKTQTQSWRLCDGPANTHIASRSSPWFYDAVHLSDMGAGLYAALFADICNSVIGQ